MPAVQLTTRVEAQGGNRLKAFLDTPQIKSRIEELMKDGSGGFITSIISIVNGNDKLQECTPSSIVSAALQAAALKLPLGAGLGFAHIVPYGKEAGFQLGWKGYVQLGQRSGQYRYMQPSVIYEGQLVEHDPFTGKMKLDAKAKKSDLVVGYLFFFELMTGFTKYFFMPYDDMERHAKKYSKSYQKGFGHWKDDFDSQGLKTVVKMGISKFGPMSVEMQKAVEVDQAVTDTTGDVVEYPDATPEPEAVPTQPAAAADVLKPTPKADAPVAPVAAADLPISPLPPVAAAGPKPL